MHGLRAVRWGHILLVLLFVAVGGLALASVASAATYTVNDPNDAALANPSGMSCSSTDGPGTCTLRAAVQASDNGGGSNTIDLPSGDYKLTIPPLCASYTTSDWGDNGCDANDPSNGDLDVLSPNQLTIIGQGAGTTTVDANHIDRAFAVANGAGLALSGVTIENGTPAEDTCNYSAGGNTFDYTCFPSSGNGDGGAIYSQGSLATTDDVVFEDNDSHTVSPWGGLGGAIDSDEANLGSGSLSIAGTTFASNAADSTGGAIYSSPPSSSGEVSVTDSTFRDNQACYGGGIAAYGSDYPMAVDHSVFESNEAECDDGGAIYWYDDSAVSLTNSSLTDNVASNGGAVYYTSDLGQGSLTVTNDQIKANSATSDGGGLYLEVGQTLMDDSELDSNSSGGDGGAIYWTAGALTSHDSSIINNSSHGNGGGLDAEPYADHSKLPSLTLINATLSDDSAGQGGGIYFGTSMPLPVALTNDTIAFDSADSGDGGGIADADDSTTSGYSSPAGESDTAGVENTIVGSNTGGDCNNAFVAADDGYNLDSDGSCFTGAAGDKTANPNLGQPADNGGAVLTDSDIGSPAVDAGSPPGGACPSTDARGVPRPDVPGTACDMGAYEAVAANLSMTMSAPASITAASPFSYDISVSNDGPGSSTNTTVIDQLPVGETLYGATSSQGSCASSGSPAKVTCPLGSIASAGDAQVTIVVAEANPGTTTNTATTTNEQEATANAWATTQVMPAAPDGGASPSTPSRSAPGAITGPATGIAKTTTSLTGTVIPGNQRTSYFFQYGPSASYGNATPVAQTGTSTQSVLTKISQLKPGTTYHYRLVAINSIGSSFGADRKFKTAATSYHGSLALDKSTLAVTHGMVQVRFTCKTSNACNGVFAITTQLQVGGAKKPATVICTKGAGVHYRIGAHKTTTVRAPLQASCLAALGSHGGVLRGSLSTQPSTARRKRVKLVALNRVS